MAQSRKKLIDKSSPKVSSKVRGLPPRPQGDAGDASLGEAPNVPY